MRKLLYLLRTIYNKIGINTAAPNTLTYGVHLLIRKIFFLINNPRKILPIKNAGRVAIIMGGGIGDHIITLRVMRDIAPYLNNQHFDLYSSRPFCISWLYNSNDNIANIYNEQEFNSSLFERYHSVLKINQFAFISNSSSTPKNCQLQKLEKLASNRKQMFHMEMQNHPYLDNYAAQKLTTLGVKRHCSPHYFLNVPYGGNIIDIPNKKPDNFKFRPKTYITIHNGFDKTLNISSSQSTKTYQNYEQVVKILTTIFPYLPIIQLGVSATSTAIQGVHHSLIDKTSLPETAYVLKNSLLHIDNESGLVHIASCFGTKCCVIFGPTSYEFFSYSENINIKSNFCGNCWWYTPDWLDKCPRGFSQAKCLAEISPRQIVSSIEPYISQHIPRALHT